MCDMSEPVTAQGLCTGWAAGSTELTAVTINRCTALPAGTLTSHTKHLPTCADLADTLFFFLRGNRFFTVFTWGALPLHVVVLHYTEHCRSTDWWCWTGDCNTRDTHYPPV